ncbi:hypothetical protein [Kingella sp. (in: b-proteobacteria)]|nr:hypothetical protein [Kingella sp. (in: b-proteobacteria)]MDO4657742.1 hypothetical protein [Kingella sp. (in: b-proteobacteria)]
MPDLLMNNSLLFSGCLCLSNWAATKSRAHYPDFTTVYAHTSSA